MRECNHFPCCTASVFCLLSIVRCVPLLRRLFYSGQTLLRSFLSEQALLIFYLSEQALFRSFSPQTALLRSFSLRAAVPSECFPRSAIIFRHLSFYVARKPPQNHFYSQLLPKSISDSEPHQRAPSLKITVRSVKHPLRQPQDHSCPAVYSASAELGWQASTERRQVWHQIHFP